MVKPFDESQPAKEEEEEDIGGRHDVENAVDDPYVATPSLRYLCELRHPGHLGTVGLSSYSADAAVSALEEVLDKDEPWTLKFGDRFFIASSDYAKKLVLAQMAKCLNEYIHSS